MQAITIAQNIFFVGVQHPDRKMFDCLMPTPRGTTYNSYIIRGEEKTALIDTVDPDFTAELLANIRNLELPGIDYILLLHTEQDHSGSVSQILAQYPNARLVATANVVKLAKTHLHLKDEQFIIMDEGGCLDLGDYSLTFHKIPFAHWPDNTMVYEKRSGILFSSDLFGSHFAFERIFAMDSYEIKESARAYYAEIMMPFASHVKKYTEKVIEMAPRMIASSHGPVWSNPALILKRYVRWTSDKVEKSVVIPYVSMHGSTSAIVDRLTWRLAAKGVSVICRNLGEDTESLSVQSGHVMNDLVMAAAVVFAMPTVLGGPHPAGAYCAMLANALRPKTLFVGLVGSYGWGTKIAETFNMLTGGVKKAERLEPLLFEGLPTEEDMKRVDAYAEQLADKILSLGDSLI